ncbi:sigma-70 family RNA polymerase sigma factor [Catenuloplanes atrovinosus]|uniref:RNA polymerase sigma-70 factor (ECF subfamily) n=1 Tax=Catenuloplanes atrovinosus TaxID=137266 RepID=A0AAE4CBC9_9ACTN|nr:sigma-70 family RNA polymerase sigma factor [Catenuloplanes atrovinosus]MDR7276749.1 RNA polymerase sigma-70 factor (ECF subfamily) [Catenuloplanes atrovinosus]
MGTAEARMRTLHERHADPVLRFLVRLVNGDHRTAEDLLQETMLRAWRHIGELGIEAENQRRWLFTVARRVAIDASRMRRARPDEIGAVDLSLLPDDADVTAAAEAAVLVRDALPRLREDHRAVLVALYYAGMTTAEMAEHFDIPDGTVKSRTHYAMRALRSIIGESG